MDTSMFRTLIEGVTEQVERFTELVNQTSEVVLDNLERLYETLGENEPVEENKVVDSLQEKFDYIKNNVTSEMAKGAVRFVEGAVRSGETLEGYSGWVEATYKRLKEEAEDPNNRW